MEPAKSSPEGFGHPPGGSRSSVELPIDVKEEVLSEEDEDGDKRTRAELLQTLKDYEKVFEEMQASLDEFTETAASESRERHSVAGQLKTEQEEVARLTADCQSLTERNRILNDAIAEWTKKEKEAREDAENAKKTLTEMGLKNLDSVELAAELVNTKLEMSQCEQREKSLREEVARLTGELAAAKTESGKQLLEAKEIIEGMLKDHRVSEKAAENATLTPGESKAMKWKFSEMEQTIAYDKVKYGLLEKERDDLKRRLEDAPPSVNVLMKKEEELEEARKRYARVLESRDATARRAEKEKAKLTDTIEGLKEEVKKLEKDRDERMNEDREDQDITILSPPPSARSDRSTEERKGSRKRGRDRSGSSESSDRNRKYEERKERLKTVEAENRRLIEVNRNIDRALENAKRAAGQMENERNYLRAVAKKQQTPQALATLSNTTEIALELSEMKRIIEAKEASEQRLEKEKADLNKTIAELRAENEDFDVRLKKIADQLQEERTPDILSPSRSSRSDHSAEDGGSHKEGGRESRKKRRSDSSESSERRKYEERKERLKELTEANLNLQLVLANTRKTVGQQEAELNMLRAAARSRNAPVASKDIAELQNEIGLLQTKNFQNEFVKHGMSERIEKAEEKAKLYDKLKDEYDEATRTKEAVEEKMKEMQDDFAREKAQLEQEAESAREMANVLSKTSMGQMKKDFEVAQKRIAELEKELQGQDGCSSSKRGKWENLVEKQKKVHELPPPPPPPFVLQGTAVIAPKIKDLRDPSKWKSFGEPIKNSVTRPDIIPPVPQTIKQSLDALGKRSRFDYRPAK